VCLRDEVESVITRLVLKVFIKVNETCNVIVEWNGNEIFQV